MNFTCDNCQHRYSIADEKVRGRTVKIRCRHCNHLITVQGPPAQTEERTTMMSIEQLEKLRAQGGTAERSPSEEKTEWFAIVKGKQAGPFDPRGIAELVRSGDVTVKSYLWRKGMAEWKRGADIPELASVFAGRAPAQAPRPITLAPGQVEGAAASAGPKLNGSAHDHLPFETDPNPEPPTKSQIKKTLDLDELFSDADLPQRPSPADEPAAPVERARPRTKARAEAESSDPFAALGGLDPDQLPPPGEATAFFIAQAGVNKRNPPWKIALFVASGIALPVGLLFLLSTFNVVPLKVKTVNASGQVVEQSVFSSEGVSSLGDILLGKRKKAASAPPPTHVATNVAKPSTEKAPPSGANMPKVVEPQGHVPTQDELAALYGDTSKSDKGPKVRKDVEEKAKDTSKGGLSDEQIARVVQQSQSAFQNCIEQELRKNPNLRVPRFYINATVANSGVVKSAAISEKSVDGSSLGECLKSRARRMTFAQFSGDEIEVQIPLIVGVAM